MSSRAIEMLLAVLVMVGVPSGVVSQDTNTATKSAEQDRSCPR